MLQHQKCLSIIPLYIIIYIRGIMEWYKMDKGEGLEGG